MSSSAPTPEYGLPWLPITSASNVAVLEEGPEFHDDAMADLSWDVAALPRNPILRAEYEQVGRAAERISAAACALLADDYPPNSLPVPDPDHASQEDLHTALAALDSLVPVKSAAEISLVRDWAAWVWNVSVFLRQC
ncbi:hypothetical protein ACJ6WD_39970 [Streptomyces sp. VTCC 41912]|uniref:hypothetical protein n=1 Tax=Streptomyces sp. VTCC 41912 TaxID=3383243 RepID=UPI003896CEEB